MSTELSMECRLSIDQGLIEGINIGYRLRLLINTRPRMPLLRTIGIFCSILDSLSYLCNTYTYAIHAKDRIKCN